MAPADDYSSKLENLGCEFIPIKMQRNGMSIVSEIKVLIDIKKSIRKANPDVILSYTIKNNVYTGLSVRGTKVKFIPNISGLGPAFTLGALRKFIVKKICQISFNRAHKVFAQNPDDLNFLISEGIAKKQNTVLLPGSGVDLQYFNEQEMPASHDSGIVFLLMARMIWPKGIAQFVQAAHKIKARNPLTRFILMGPLDQESMDSISQKQLDEWVSKGAVEYLGSKEDVRSTIGSAHCVVLPSFYKEGTPKSLLEALACARPIITTREPGCNQTVIEGVNGYLVNARSADDLAEAMKKFINLSPSEMQSMAKNSRRIAEERFDENIVVGEYLSAIREVF